MSPITDAPNGLLRWSLRPGRTFLLHFDAATGDAGEAGRLFFSQRSGSLAKGETVFGEWTFKSEGFLHPRITVRKTGSETNCASMTLSADGNGRLSLNSGEEFEFVTSGWMHSQWAFQRGPFEVVRFSRDGSSTDVEIVISKVAPETLSILVLLGWYAPLLAADEAAEIAASPVRNPSPAAI